MRKLHLRTLAGAAAIAIVTSACGSTAQPNVWIPGPTIAPAAAAATASPFPTPTPTTSNPVVPSAEPTAPAGSPVTVDPSATPKPFSGRMDPQVGLMGGYVSMYMDLVNTGSEPLTFINTLYDTEPTRLYSPLVAFPWVAGGTAAITREGHFFPSPAIVQPGHHAVYLMGGIEATGSGELGPPVANIKFCPTRGMDDVPAVPVKVENLTWTENQGVTTVHGTLVETEGSSRPDPPIVGVAFFDKAGAFVGAVVDSRVGDRLAPHASIPFEISGMGVDDSRIDHAAGYAYVS